MKLFVTSNFSCFHNVFLSYISLLCQNAALCGNGLRAFSIIPKKKEGDELIPDKLQVIRAWHVESSMSKGWGFFCPKKKNVRNVFFLWPSFWSQDLSDDLSIIFACNLCVESCTDFYIYVLKVAQISTGCSSIASQILRSLHDHHFLIIS